MPWLTALLQFKVRLSAGRCRPIQPSGGGTRSNRRLRAHVWGFSALISSENTSCRSTRTRQTGSGRRLGHLYRTDFAGETAGETTDETPVRKETAEAGERLTFNEDDITSRRRACSTRRHGHSRLVTSRRPLVRVCLDDVMVTGHLRRSSATSCYMERR